MTVKQMIKLFDRCEDDGEALEFGRIERKRSLRPDVHALIVIDELVPGVRPDRMVRQAWDDILYLNVEPAALAKVATEAVIIELARCGVGYTSEGNSLIVSV